MVTVKKHAAAALALGLVMSALATPSFAQRSEDGMSAARAAAIRECRPRPGSISNTSGATWRKTHIAPAWPNTASRSKRPRQPFHDFRASYDNFVAVPARRGRQACNDAEPGT
jgi:hypothetical protein